MRQLVYRVQALPQSILPLVWDFGQLTIEVEKLYIKQMVHRCVCIVVVVICAETGDCCLPRCFLFFPSNYLGIKIYP